ncbi:DoxX family protein [Longitalea luteola]|uniref:DoxX family protein n=1 Tax=Longitalea luteola TaxID=2812563 RepID=UPI001A975407|nr:DoxX family protein [Longitalea luteola]
MKHIAAIGQLLLRLALGVGFLLPVMDRIGLLGSPGSGASWGDWKHFVRYTNELIPFVSWQIANIMSIIATIAEIVFGVLLIVGYRIKEVAIGAGILTFVFGLCMGIFLSIQAPFNYPVFVFTGAAFVLSGLDHHAWSIDSLSKNDLNK